MRPTRLITPEDAPVLAELLGSCTDAVLAAPAGALSLSER